MKHCKIKVSWLWIPFLFTYVYLHLFKTLAFIFMFLTIHELAHMLMAWLFHYPIRKVILYPFGLCAVIDSIGYQQGIKDFIILIAGPLTHLVQPFLLLLLKDRQLISQSYEQYLLLINTSILLFNLLPVYPLDGGRILELFTQLFFPFTLAKKVTMLGSIIFLCCLLYYHVLAGMSGLAVCVLLMIENIMQYRSLTYRKLQFYRYRMRTTVTYPIRMNQGKDLYRFSHNIMKYQDQWIDEQKWLSVFFHKR